MLKESVLGKCLKEDICVDFGMCLCHSFGGIKMDMKVKGRKVGNGVTAVSMRRVMYNLEDSLS